MAEEKRSRARDVTLAVLGEAFGSSATPWVPVPFVDDIILGRILRRAARKVLTRGSVYDAENLAKVIVDSYIEAGEDPLAKRAVVGAARFVVRKLAVVLDVKKSHDVFGETIALALAVDIAMENGWVHESHAQPLGQSIHRSITFVGSGLLEALARTARSVVTAPAPAPAPEGEGEGSSRFSRFSGGVTKAVVSELDEARRRLEEALQRDRSALRV
jgi:hypothetical protein